MSRSSVPFSMPSYHIQLKSTDRRSLAPAAGVYGAPAFGSALRPRPCAPPGPCAAPRPAPASGACARAADAPPAATATASAIVVQQVLRRKLMPILCLLTTEPPRNRDGIDTLQISG